MACASPGAGLTSAAGRTCDHTASSAGALLCRRVAALELCVLVALDPRHCGASQCGFSMVVHEKPHQRGSWEPHGKLGWYLGPALEHYRCHRCHIIATNSERISDTVEFFPHNTEVEKLTTQEAAVIAAESLVQALKQSKPPKNLAGLIDPTKTVIQQLQRIIHPSAPIEAKLAEPPRVRTPPRVETITPVPTNEPK
jgi:hypothetical protein